MANEERFTGLAAQYARYRPSYPDAALDWILQKAGVAKADAVADVGAGTGIFSGLLLARGLRVFAVEPNADMRAEALSALSGRSGFSMAAGGAEQTGLAEGSVQLVCAAQAFHWFDPARFQAECRRILAPGGMAAVLWNSRDARTPLVREYEKLRRAYEVNTSGWRCVAPGTASEGVRAFFANGFEAQVFENPIAYDEDGFIGHALSASYAPKPGDDKREAYERALAAFFGRHQQGGRMVMPMVTEVYLGAP